MSNLAIILNMKKLLISACLLGEACRYDGSSKGLDSNTINALKTKFILIPICPEVMGGLSTPRLSNERKEDKVIRSDKKDVTRFFNLGAYRALNTAIENEVDYALLKEKSPSCGLHQIYDGSFSKTLISGEGVFTELLKKKTNIKIFNELEIEDLLKMD